MSGDWLTVERVTDPLPSGVLHALVRACGAAGADRLPVVLVQGEYVVLRLADWRAWYGPLNSRAPYLTEREGSE